DYYCSAWDTKLTTLF
nr:immunoglobulin light chain junction region [Macaca mulatta]MOX17566.1 immunoglobulin light chain junction region [Macaca mulatta]MOX18094.1 immunoglobulin light chain junction region [Macaca mulatta]MOX18305.1 immunoglobulin light chain junction region [Macaca mulatta]MOX18341.1 immunoglobulin light chain junction region [Macaca mulatta]